MSKHLTAGAETGNDDERRSSVIRSFRDDARALSVKRRIEEEDISLMTPPGLCVKLK
jgi:hypothetical protein